MLLEGLEAGRAARLLPAPQDGVICLATGRFGETPRGGGGVLGFHFAAGSFGNRSRTLNTAST